MIDTVALVGVVGWDNLLQAVRLHFGFLMVSLEFFIDIIFPAAI